MGLGQHNAVIGDLGLQGFQALFEVCQVVAHPDRTYTAGRHEHAQLAQLVTDADLTVGRVFNGVIDHGVFRFFIDTVLEVWSPPGLLQQRLNATVFNGIAIAIKRVSRQSHHLTGLRDITKFLGQIEKADFMTDDFLVTLQHEGYLLMVLMVSVCTAIKTGNPLLFQGAVSD